MATIEGCKIWASEFPLKKGAARRLFYGVRTCRRSPSAELSRLSLSLFHSRLSAGQQIKDDACGVGWGWQQ